VCFFFFSSPARAQNNSDLPDAPSQMSADSQHENEPYERVTSWHRLTKDFLHDQKAIWLFPVQLAKGRHWAPTLAVAGLTARAHRR
jgi:hypothetical protein